MIMLSYIIYNHSNTNKIIKNKILIEIIFSLDKNLRMKIQEIDKYIWKYYNCRMEYYKWKFRN